MLPYVLLVLSMRFETTYDCFVCYLGSAVGNAIHDAVYCMFKYFSRICSDSTQSLSTFPSPKLLAPPAHVGRHPRSNTTSPHAPPTSKPSYIATPFTPRPHPPKFQTGSFKPHYPKSQLATSTAGSLLKCCRCILHSDPTLLRK